MAGYYASCPCGWRECDGCEEEPTPDSETLSLMETPEGMGLETIENGADPRDRTPPPPALLNPRSVMRNRERTRRLLATGEFTWPRPSEAA